MKQCRALGRRMGGKPLRNSGFHLVECGSEESARAQLARRFVGTGKVPSKGGGHDNFASRVSRFAIYSSSGWLRDMGQEVGRNEVKSCGKFQLHLEVLTHSCIYLFYS